MFQRAAVPSEQTALALTANGSAVRVVHTWLTVSITSQWSDLPVPKYPPTTATTVGDSGAQPMFARCVGWLGNADQVSEGTSYREVTPVLSRTCTTLSVPTPAAQDPAEFSGTGVRSPASTHWSEEDSKGVTQGYNNSSQ
eukprot:JP446502.1.p1 GENE.JP446502.1~~JP446502.1.p1  ORF type:complete len:140 (+),score=9.23 JP446502.1:462-881(+)